MDNMNATLTMAKKDKVHRINLKATVNNTSDTHIDRESVDLGNHSPDIKLTQIEFKWTIK